MGVCVSIAVSVACSWLHRNCWSVPQYEIADVLNLSLVPHLPGELVVYLLEAGESCTE